MYFDNQETFSLAQAVTALGDTASTNIYDTGSAADIGPGTAIFIFVKTQAAFASAGAATLQVVLQDAALEAGPFADVQTISGTVALAGLTANTKQVRARLPIGLRRYLRLSYRVGTAAMTAGSVTAFMGLNVDANRATPSGISAV